MGIYIHIPFCHSKCFYCGFYSSVAKENIDQYFSAMEKEISLRTHEVDNMEIKTLYIGGGTPSSVLPSYLEKIIDKVNHTWNLSSCLESTIEVNPEDRNKFHDFYRMGFNRLSMGVQSFSDSILKQINRKHFAHDAVLAIEDAVNAGFSNISIDLIIGLPGQTMADICHDICLAVDLPITHISVYMLSVDSNSVMERLQQKGKFTPPSDDDLADGYNLICDELEKAGFDHYEISNFSRNDMYSRHNTSYWKQQPYIGLGAAAHSYDGINRQWNVASISSYIQALNDGNICREQESLNENERYDEMIMTRLRTKWGLNEIEIADKHPKQWKAAQNILKKYIQNGYAFEKNGILTLSRKGWLISDAVFRDLFFE